MLLWSSLCEIRIFIASFPLFSALNQAVTEKKVSFPDFFFPKTKLICSSSHGLYPFYTTSTTNTYSFWLAPFAESQILKKKNVSFYDKGLLCATHLTKAAVLQQEEAQRPQLLSLDLENIYM